MGKPESLIPISGIRELALFRLPPQQCAVCNLPFCLYAQTSGSAVIIEGNGCFAVLVQLQIRIPIKSATIVCWLWRLYNYFFFI